MHSPTQQLEDVPRRTARVEFRHYVLFQVLFTLAFVVLVFGGVELVARIRQYHRFGPKSLHPMALRDQFTAYRLNPAYGRVDRQHDAQGFRREKDVSLEKPPIRIEQQFPVQRVRSGPKKRLRNEAPHRSSC